MFEAFHLTDLWKDTFNEDLVEEEHVYFIAMNLNQTTSSLVRVILRNRKDAVDWLKINKLS